VARTIPGHSRAFQYLPRHPSGVEPLVTTQRTLSGKVRKEVERVLEIIQDVSAEIERSSRILNWISPISPYYDHEMIQNSLGKNYRASGKWLEEDDDFLCWEGNAYRMLLLEEVTGAGKSTLTSIVVN
jgi:hypothetical protein